jgi:hypothetical protein
MNPVRTFKVGLALVLFALSVDGSSSRPISKFDDYGDVNCEDEWARLDNFAIALSNRRSLRAT